MIEWRKTISKRLPVQLGVGIGVIILLVLTFTGNNSRFVTLSSKTNHEKYNENLGCGVHAEVRP